MGDQTKHVPMDQRKKGGGPRNETQADPKETVLRKEPKKRTSKEGGKISRKRRAVSETWAGMFLVKKNQR